MRRRCGGIEEDNDNINSRSRLLSQSSSSTPKFFPFSLQKKLFISQSFLHRFHNPTIFLRISCDGDFLLPIVVGICKYKYTYKYVYVYTHTYTPRWSSVSCNILMYSLCAGEFAIEKLLDTNWGDQNEVTLLRMV